MKHLFVSDRDNPYTTPKDALRVDPWPSAGGRSHVFGRCLLRWTDDDFRSRTRTGKGEDWPVDYAELVPYYEEVEKNLGIYGRQDNVPTQPDSVYTHEAKLTPAEESFKTDLERKWPERRVITWRYMAPEPTRVLRPLRDAIASGNLDIRYNTIAKRVLTDTKTNRATGAEVVDRLTGAVSTISAASVVLCASPIESIRLMLNSANAQNPEGLGNSSGLVGRYFMDQLACVAKATYPKARGFGPADTAPEDPFTRHPAASLCRALSARMGMRPATSISRVASAVIPPTRTARRASRSLGFGIMQPDANNRVTLDPKVKDAWGIPAPHIRCKMGKEDEKTLQKEVDTAIEMIEGVRSWNGIGSALGLIERGRAYPEENPISRILFRSIFTKTMAWVRQSTRLVVRAWGPPRTIPVLDSWNRSWDIPNLLVTDASAFPTSGIAGTTLTIMAMTVRACRKLAADLAETKH